MFVLKRFLAFIAAGLLLVAAKYYPTDIALGKYGDVTYYDGFDRETFSGSTYSFVRADCTGGENAAELNAGNLAKVREFAEFAACYRLPLVVFSDVAGIAPCACTNNSRVLKEAAEYLNILDTIDTAKIAVVYKRAVGLGYSLFAAKSAGFDYSCAFATAKIALFDDVKGAEIEFANEKADKAALAERYADEKADPVNAAKDGYIDDVIEPQFVKQYLISALQMLVG